MLSPQRGKELLKVSQRDHGFPRKEKTGMLMGRHEGEYPVSVGLAEESIFCSDAVESKGLYKVGGREGHVVHQS